MPVAEGRRRTPALTYRDSLLRDRDADRNGVEAIGPGAAASDRHRPAARRRARPPDVRTALDHLQPRLVAVSKDRAASGRDLAALAAHGDRLLIGVADDRGRPGSHHRQRHAASRASRTGGSARSRRTGRSGRASCARWTDPARFAAGAGAPGGTGRTSFTIVTRGAGWPSRTSRPGGAVRAGGSSCAIVASRAGGSSRTISAGGTGRSRRASRAGWTFLTVCASRAGWARRAGRAILTIGPSRAGRSSCAVVPGRPGRSIFSVRAGVASRSGRAIFAV